MPGLSYAISVHSPCTGEQIVSKVDSNLYVGSNGDFNYALLTKPPSSSAWLLTIYDFSGSACTPFKNYTQVTPNAGDPSGGYGLDTPSGPDPALGEATITAFP